MAIRSRKGASYNIYKYIYIYIYIFIQDRISTLT